MSDADSSSKKKTKRRRGNASLASMAWANLWRNKKRTITVICSLTLGLVLLSSFYAKNAAFDMDKYLADLILADFELDRDYISELSYETPSTYFECGAMVTPVPAYNKNHPKSECVGFLVTLDGKLVYFAGDTSRTEQMETFAQRHIDYAILPMDGIYNMDIAEASACARLIAAKHSIPTHMAPGRLFDRAAAERFDGPGRLILEPGEEITL